MSNDVLVVAKGDFAAVVVTPTFKEHSFEVITSLNRPIFESVLKALHRIYKVASVTPTITETSSSLNIDSIQAIGFNGVTYSFILERNNQWMCARNLITELNEFYIRESAKLILSNRLIGIGSDTPQYTHAVVEWFNRLDFYNSPAPTPKPSASVWDSKKLTNVALAEPEEIITVKGGAKLIVKAKKPAQKEEKKEEKSGLKVHKGVGSLGSRLAMISV